MSGHPEHPKCAACSKPLYKSFEKGKAVKKSDPWNFCRNVNCERFGPDGIGDASKLPASFPLAGDDRADSHLKVEKALDEDAEERKKDKIFQKRFKKFRAERIAEQESGRARKEESKAEPESEPKPEETPKKRRRAARPPEPEHMRLAREQLRPLIEKIAPEGADRVSVGLVLAILNQETGSKEAANLLIDQYGLGEKFGMQKF